ncbi:DUF3037 domain-containing protein [soil metagenome]
MQEKDLFEYAVIRVVPRVEREEFLNVGIVLYCPKQKYLSAKFSIDEARLQAFSPQLDIEEVKTFLKAFCKICKGAPDSGPIGMLAIAERFRWLSATRSTVVQTSKTHPGLTSNAGDTLERLFTELVLQ